MPDPLFSSLRRRVTRRGKHDKPTKTRTPNTSISSMSEVSSGSSSDHDHDHDHDHDSSDSLPSTSTSLPLPSHSAPIGSPTPSYTYNDRFTDPPRKAPAPPRRVSYSSSETHSQEGDLPSGPGENAVPAPVDVPAAPWRRQMLDLASSYHVLSSTTPGDFTATTTATAHHNAVLRRLNDAETTEREALAVLRAYLDQIYTVQRKSAGVV